MDMILNASDADQPTGLPLSFVILDNAEDHHIEILAEFVRDGWHMLMCAEDDMIQCPHLAHEVKVTIKYDVAK